jgi:glycosyltransferase involved in cell wall biosynthesis
MRKRDSDISIWQAKIHHFEGAKRMTGNLILVTPIKNEAENIPQLVRSVASQKKIPILWVVVDDGSTDGSDRIIEETIPKYSWIFLLRLPKSERDIGFHYSHVCRVGFFKALALAQQKEIEFEYIALLDADITLESNYFATLNERMEQDPKIGIASGGTWSLKKGEYYQEKQIQTMPSGCARIWKRKCFIETNGYEDTMAPDSISNARANLAGWKTQRFEDIKAYQSRPVGSAEGLSKGYFKYGEAHYFRWVHPVVILAKAFLLVKKGHINLSIAYLKGYLHAFKTKIPRLTDPELIKYFRTNSINTFLRVNDETH